MKLYLTESQFQSLINEEAIMEGIFNKDMSFDEIVKNVRSLARRGLLTASLIANIVFTYNLSQTQKNTLETVAQVEQKIEQKAEEKLDDQWTLLADDVKATVYNAVPSQCNSKPNVTASMFKLNLKDVLSHRIIAMERTMMKEYGLKYGDVVKIEGTGTWDGVWQIQDTMNKRFAGQHKIDILVPNNIRLGKWDGVKVYRPATPETEEQAWKEINQQA